MGFATDAIHAGQSPDATARAVTTPIYQTSTYVHESLGVHKGFEYARTQNPTRAALEANLTALEGGKAGFCFASGMAAIHAVSTLLKAGDHAVVSRNVYGGTFRIFKRVLAKGGLDSSFIDTTDLGAVERAITPATKMLFIETPTNPMLEITDLAAVAALARQRGLISVVDNTFMSPYLQRPLDLGIDLVVHSTTKFLNGHSDSVGGAVIATRPEHAEWLGFVQNAVGAILSPFDSWLVLRGVKTLPLRMRAHEENGRAVATYLARHPKVRRTFYPGLPDHPQHELAKRQMRGFGALVTFELGSFENAKTFLNRLRLCSLGESLGGVETLISHPASMTHASLPAEMREELGISPGMVRISVGVEDLEDLLADLDHGFAGLPV